MIQKMLHLAFAVAAHAAMAADSSVPPFAKGDLVAFAGDSITSGGTYHKYIFTYWATRHPELGVRFRNKGIFSDFVRGGIGRLERDILKEKPNKVAINFGMNDSGASYRKDLFGMSNPGETVLQKRRETVATYRANMEKLLALLKERGIAPVLIGPSIYDNTMTSEAANNHGANSGIQACIEELKTLKNESGFVDFNAPMLEVNARMQAKDPAFGIAGGDRVHPGPEGHWVMAYEFLKAQNASPMVASVKVDATKGAVLENANCAVEALQAADGKVSFDYLPRSLPLPVNDEYRRGEKVIPITESLNREMLAVQGLASDRYTLLLDGQNAGELTAEELAKGVNIATLDANPGQRRAKTVDALIQERAKQEGRIRQLRQMECGMPGKKTREEIAAAASSQLDEAKKQDNKIMIGRLAKFLEDLPQEDSIDQSILDLEQQIFAAAKPEPIKVSIDLAGTTPRQPASITPVPRTEPEENWVSNHEARVAAAKKSDIDVIVIGDSITHYSGGSPAYQRHFAARKVLNLGQGGDRTQNVLWRLQNGEVEGLQPKVAMLMIGTNNIGRGETPEDTVLGIKAVLAELKQRLPNTKVVLCSILPRGGAIMTPIGKANAQLHALADGKQVIHLDLTNDFQNPDASLNESLFGGDKVHLNGEGYRVWFEKAEPHIAAALTEIQLIPTAPK